METFSDIFFSSECRRTMHCLCATLAGSRIGYSGKRNPLVRIMVFGGSCSVAKTDIVCKLKVVCYESAYRKAVQAVIARILGCAWWVRSCRGRATWLCGGAAHERLRGQLVCSRYLTQIIMCIVAMWTERMLFDRFGTCQLELRGIRWRSGVGGRLLECQYCINLINMMVEK